MDRPMIVNGEVVRHSDGSIVMNKDYNWYDVWNPSLGEHPFAARVMVHRKDFDHPTVGIATWEAYAKPYKGTKDFKNQWDTNGPNQLAKCAEALALRKAYPMELSGLYTNDELAEDIGELDNETDVTWEDDADDCTSSFQIKALYQRMKDEKEWTPRRDAHFRAKLAALLEAESKVEEPDSESVA